MSLPDPPVGLVWWTDGVHATALTAEEITAWRERGVAYGWVVVADGASQAVGYGKALAENNISRFSSRGT